MIPRWKRRQLEAAERLAALDPAPIGPRQSVVGQVVAEASPEGAVASKASMRRGGEIIQRVMKERGL